MNIPCSNTYYETLYNSVQASIEPSKAEELHMYSLVEETAVEELLGSSELIEDMLGEYHEEIVELMSISLSGKDSVEIGLLFNDIKDKIVGRVSKMYSVQSRAEAQLLANQKLNQLLDEE